MIKPESIEDMETFLALSYLLETESADRYSELSDNMKAHHDPEIAQLFIKLSHYGEQHASEIMEHADGLVLPAVASWEFEWQNPEGPETTPFEAINYQMSADEVLHIALANEKRGRDFYANIAKKSTVESIRKLAAEFSAEETEHVQLLEQWIAEIAQKSATTRDDLDPPHVPE